MLSARDGLLEAARRQRSAAICRRLSDLPEVGAANLVFCFVSFGSEVATLPFIEWCLAHGVRVAVPRVVECRSMTAVRITSCDDDLEPGTFGIPEPHRGLPAVDPTQIDVAVVPGAGFDLAGGRTGYGGGFYDTYLPQLSSAAAVVGAAFDLQIIDKVPRGPHDVTVGLLMTETRTVRCLDNG